MMDEGLQFNLPKNRSSVIKVIGVGGGGSNAVNYMSHLGVNGVDFIVCNTDAQALENSVVTNKVQLGASLTEGLGAGADPEIGRQAAEESLPEIQKILETGTKMCFVTAGMGGGTGTGAAPVIAKAARDMGILTVGIVTAPFSFEGKLRMEQAEIGTKAMRDAVDSLIVINNDKLRQVYGDLGFRNAFAKADEVLAGAAKGIAEVITNHYTANIDLRDAKTVLENSGSALFGTGKGQGAQRAAEAIQGALDSPLLNDNHIKGAKNVLLLITSGEGEHEVTIDEIGEITDYIQHEAGGNANVIMGIGSQEEEGSNLTCTIVATGFPTGTRVLPSDRPEVVKHVLYENEQQAETAPAAVVETPAAPEAPQRVVMELGEIEEEPELPQSAVQEETLPVAEETLATEEAVMDAPLTSEIEAEVAESEPVVAHLDEEEMGFPQEPSDIDAAMEQGFDGTEVEEDAPQVHVLEWSYDDDEVAAEEEPQVHASAAEQAIHQPEAQVEWEEEAEEETKLPPVYDLFSMPPAMEEDMMTLTFAEDEEETEATVTDVPVAQVPEVFEAPAPEASEEDHHGMLPTATPLEAAEQVQWDQPMPEEVKAEVSNHAEEEVKTFTLDDIDGDGFALSENDWNEADAEESPKQEPISTADYDPFEMSLSELPELGQKAKLQEVDRSFQWPADDFDSARKPAAAKPEVELIEEDPDLAFEVKQIPADQPKEDSDMAAATAKEPIAKQEARKELTPSDLMERPLSQMPKLVQERKNRLEQFQYRFKSNQNNLAEAERVPAYMRQGIELDHQTKSTEQPSNMGVDKEGNLRTNNSFLHDNVD